MVHLLILADMAILEFATDIILLNLHLCSILVSLLCEELVELLHNTWRSPEANVSLLRVGSVLLLLLLLLDQGLSFLELLSKFVWDIGLEEVHDCMRSDELVLSVKDLNLFMWQLLMWLNLVFKVLIFLVLVLFEGFESTWRCSWSKVLNLSSFIFIELDRWDIIYVTNVEDLVSQSRLLLQKNELNVISLWQVSLIKFTNHQALVGTSVNVEGQWTLFRGGGLLLLDYLVLIEVFHILKWLDHNNKEDAVVHEPVLA
jgi:hypothetical protein